MDILKLLESFEELLYRLALWVVLGPKTLYFVFRSPTLINRYVSEQLEKSPDDRFKEMLSPVLFWILIALVPHLMLIDFLATLPGSRVSTELEWVAFMKAPWVTRLTLVSIVALAGPLAISSRVLGQLGKPVDRETLRAPFFVQCYSLTPVYIFLLPFVFFSLRYEDIPDGAATYISGTACVAAVSWFFVAESAVLSQQLSVSRLKAVIKAGGYALVVYIALFVLEVAVMTVFNGLSVWMKP
jgi:hypothetical protein